MEKPLVLTFDVGTQSARAVMVDREGNIVFKAQKTYDKPYYSKNPDWAEQNADFYWQTICRCSNELKEKAGTRWRDIVAVTVTTIRDTTLCIDENGNPLRDVIVWLDKRKANCSKKISGVKMALFKAVNMTDTGASAKDVGVQLDNRKRARNLGKDKAFRFFVLLLEFQALRKYCRL